MQFFFTAQNGYLDAEFDVRYTGAGVGESRDMLFAGTSSLCTPPPPPISTASAPSVAAAAVASAAIASALATTTIAPTAVGTADGPKPSSPARVPCALSTTAFDAAAAATLAFPAAAAARPGREMGPDHCCAE